MKTKVKYKLIGAVQMITEIDRGALGYYDDLEIDPVLIYESDKNNGNIYTKKTGYSIDDTYKILPDHMIKETYTVEEALNKYPELFL